MKNFFEVVTFNDILFALVAAFVLTSIIKWIFANFRFVGITSNIKVNYDRRNLKSVLMSCYELFPKEFVTFGGDTFKRGSQIQIMTIGNHKITGELVGVNNENMICLLTTKHIIAHELSQVLDISLVDANLPKEDDDGLCS